MKILSRRRKEFLFKKVCIGFTLFSVFVLFVLLAQIIFQGCTWLNWNFLTSFPSRFPTQAGLISALYGSIWVISLTAFFAIPFGVSTAVYLEEYAKKNFLNRLIQINIANLAGMPSIIYGLIGLTVFVRYMHMGRSILAGSLTLALLVVPIIIISSQEAIRAVPSSLREAAYALGARRWQVVLGQVLPAALPGIMTGVILSISRAIGETAPLIVIGALSYVAFVPNGPMDTFTVLPVQIYNWVGRPQHDFHSIAAAGIIVLLVVLLSMNFVAVLIREKFQKYKLD